MRVHPDELVRRWFELEVIEKYEGLSLPRSNGLAIRMIGPYCRPCVRRTIARSERVEQTAQSTSVVNSLSTALLSQ